MRKLVQLLLSALACFTPIQVLAQSTIFTYQGRLSVNGTPATGLYDFKFTIYKIETNGTLIAGPLTNTAVQVSGGLFTIPLDFGHEPFLGVNRFMEVAVRANGSPTDFTLIGPRVRIASAPYAIAAANVIDGAVTASSLSPGPGPDGQVLKMSGGVLAWGPGNGSGSVFSVGTGEGLLGGPITTSGTISLDPTLVPFLSGTQTFSGSNVFTGIISATNANNRFAGAFFGNGAGLSNIVANSTNSSVTLAGDVTGSSAAATVARIRNVNVLATPPTAGQHLRFSGTDWTPAAVALGTDVTGTLADARLSANVPLLNANQTFTGSNTFNGASSLTNVNNKFAGAFFGNGAGLSNIVASTTNTSVNMAGDVIGTSASSTVAKIRGINVSGLVPSANQFLRYNGTDWAPGAVALGTDVTGTLADARLSGNVALLNGNQTFTGSNTFNGAAIITNLNNRFSGTFTGNGSSLTTLNAANVSSGTLADARLSGNVALLNANQAFSGSNTFSGVSSLTNVNNRFAGAFFGNGAGLSNIVATSSNTSVTLAGDVTGSSAAATVARIRSVNVLATAPAAGQHLRFSGTDWTPAAVSLGTDVSGTLPVANGGTGATTPATARTTLGAAASGANSDITSLGALSTPISTTQGGSGQTTYNTGDMLYASAANTLSKRAIGTSGQVLSVSGSTPIWSAANNHDHFGQVWSGVAVDGLFLQNTSAVAGASALTASSWATNDIAYGVFGQTASSEGIGVEGFAFATAGLSTGVFGESTSTNGTGVYGFGSASSGQPIGVYGESDAPLGIGIYGIGAGTNGSPVGVYGTVSTPGGYGLYTPNRLFVGDAATVIGPLSAAKFFGDGSGLSNLVATATNSAVTLAGDVTGSSTAATVAKIRNVNVLATTPATGQVLRFSGTDWTPAAVVLGTDVTGTLADARLSANVALRNANQVFTGTNSFTPPAGPPFIVSSTNVVTNLNADRVDGLSGTQFLRSDASSTLTSGNLTFASGTRLLAAAGSVTSPGVAFSSSPTAGAFNPATNVIAFATASTERLRIAADGKTGIGRSPTANAFELEGNASKTSAGSWLANSDARIKTNVQTVDHALDKIDHVRPVGFHYTEEYRAAHPSLEDKTYYNVIAQEFAKVFPDAVKESGETLDGKPILQVDIHPAAVYAIAAIKELHEIVKAKDEEMARLKEHNEKLEKRLDALEKAASGSGR
jgi:hypothetical protein